MRNNGTKCRGLNVALRFAVGALVLLAIMACGGSDDPPAASPTAPSGLFSTLPTTELPIEGDQPPTVELNTPEPTFTPQPTFTPNPTYTPVPSPTPEPTGTPVPTPEPTPVPTPVPTPDSSGNSLLCDAVVNSEYLLTERLARVTDVNVECPNGQLPLYLAIIGDSFLIIEALAEADANVNASHSDGNPLLYHAIVHPRGGLNDVDALITAGADVNAKAVDENPLLYHAIIHERGLNLVLSLIRGDADVNARAADGNPLLYHAIVQPGGRLNDVEALINGGANVNSTDAEGNSLLSVAVEQDDLNVIDALIKAGALP